MMCSCCYKIVLVLIFILVCVCVCVFMRNNGTHLSIGGICVVHLQYNNVRGVCVRGVDIAYYPM